MKFLIPAAVGLGVAVFVNRMLLDRIRAAQFPGDVEDGVRNLEAYGGLTGALAGIGALALFRKFGPG